MMAYSAFVKLQNYGIERVYHCPAWYVGGSIFLVSYMLYNFDELALVNVGRPYCIFYMHLMRIGIKVALLFGYMTLALLKFSKVSNGGANARLSIEIFSCFVTVAILK